MSSDEAGEEPARDCAESSGLVEALAGGAEAVTTAAETGVAGTAGSVAAETGAAGAGAEASEAAPDGRVTSAKRPDPSKAL